MNTSNDVLTLLDSVLGTHKAQGRGEYLFSCPFCNHHKPKLAINVVTNRWHCWVCETGGRSVKSLLYKMNVPKSVYRQYVEISDDKSIRLPEEPDQITPVMLPSEFIPLWNSEDTFEKRHALKYLRDRNITMFDIMRYGLGYCVDGMYEHRVIIPSYGADGKLNFFTARSYYEGMNPPYRNPPVSKNIVGFESLISWEFPVVLCEGPFDAIAIRRNAIPLFGKTLPQAVFQKIIENEVKDVFVALDPDALSNRIKITKRLMDQDINVHVIEFDDEDPAEAGFDRIQEKVKESSNTVQTFSSLIKQKLNLT